MVIKVINSNSMGNCYILEGQRQTLILECGVPFLKIAQTLKYDLSKVVGCVVSHSHKDHCKSIQDVICKTIPVYANKHVIESNYLEVNPLAVEINNGVTFKVGEFKIKPFDVQHDVPTLGFYINHPEVGNILFVTDTYYVKYTFPNLNILIVECNYDDDIIQEKYVDKTFLKSRIFSSHFSYKNCIGFLDANDLSKVREILLIHLSDSNSDEQKFLNGVISKTGISTTIAKAGVELNVSQKLEFEL